MKLSNRHSNKGFTLIEIIVTLTLVAVAGTVMYQYSGTILTNSTKPLTNMGQAFSLQKVMETIFADYKLNYPSNLAGIKTKIGATASQQLPPAGYGPYTLVYNDFIKFVGNVETPIVSGDPQNMLKVTIKNALGETLTVLFTQ